MNEADKHIANLRRLNYLITRAGWSEYPDDATAAADYIELLRNIVNEQAEDEGLWFDAQHAPEAYLQQELRKLHAAIEGKSCP